MKNGEKERKTYIW